MPTDPFEGLRDRETPTSSVRWYQDNIRKLGLNNVPEQQVLKSSIGEFVTSIQIGSMYLFRYDPKTADTLPYYDTFPLVVPFRKTSDGFYGLNFHYLPYLIRLRLLDRMMKLINTKGITETTRMRLNWNLLTNVSQYPGATACVKRYLYYHINSRVMQIYPNDWRKTVMLPIDNFEKKSRNDVFVDTRRKM